MPAVIAEVIPGRMAYEGSKALHNLTVSAARNGYEKKAHNPFLTINGVSGASAKTTNPLAEALATERLKTMMEGYEINGLVKAGWEVLPGARTEDQLRELLGQRQR